MPLLRGSYEVRADNRAHTGNQPERTGGTEQVRDPYWHDTDYRWYDDPGDDDDDGGGFGDS